MPSTVQRLRVQSLTGNVGHSQLEMKKKLGHSTEMQTEQ